MPLFLSIIIFIVSLVVLIKAADYFTASSERIGLALGIPQFIIGVTILAIGTSLPELASSIAAVLQGAPDVVAGNVIGSNIANVLLVTGFVAIVSRKLIVERSLINLDLPLFAMTVGIFIALTIDRDFTWIDGIFAIIAFVVYAMYSVYAYRQSAELAEERVEDIQEKTKKGRQKLKARDVIIIIVSIVVVVLGARYLISSLIDIADAFNIGTSIIALTAVALGTSLPEILVSVQAARRKNYDLALGNIFGSNIFNLTLVMAIPSFFGTLEISNATLMIGVPMLIVSSVIFVISGISRKIHNWEGAFMLILYAVYLGIIFGIL
ncbi:calcium/sodium antiporter [Patescibacteria group bacterium]